MPWFLWLATGAALMFLAMMVLGIRLEARAQAAARRQAIQRIELQSDFQMQQVMHDTVQQLFAAVRRQP